VKTVTIDWTCSSSGEKMLQKKKALWKFKGFWVSYTSIVPRTREALAILETGACRGSSVNRRLL
jgi:hypothetical protein